MKYYDNLNVQLLEACNVLRLKAYRLMHQNKGRIDCPCFIYFYLLLDYIFTLPLIWKLCL